MCGMLSIKVILIFQLIFSISKAVTFRLAPYHMVIVCLAYLDPLSGIEHQRRLKVIKYVLNNNNNNNNM